jgi:hypothetical protein
VTTELDLLREAGAVTEPSTEVFDHALQSLFDVMTSDTVSSDSADPVASQQRPPTRAWHPRRRSRLKQMVGAVGVAVAAALLSLFLLPSSGGVPVAEAAQFRFIAANAAQQPVLELGPHQWLRTKQVLSLSLGVNRQVPITTISRAPLVRDVEIPARPRP